MSDTISLELQQRDVMGKAVAQLRRDGFVPAVIHDHGKPSHVVMGKFMEVSKAYQKAGKHHPVELTSGTNKFTALIKDVTFDPRKNQLSHIVFGAVKADEKVEAEIPVRLSDDIPAEKASLLVINQLDTVQVEALPKDLPDELLVDASGLVEIGDKLTVADIVAPAGVTILTEPEHALATVYEPSAVAAANDAAGGDAVLPDEAEAPAEGEEAPAAEGAAADSESADKSSEPAKE